MNEIHIALRPLTDADPVPPGTTRDQFAIIATPVLVQPDGHGGMVPVLAVAPGLQCQLIVPPPLFLKKTAPARVQLAPNPPQAVLDALLDAVVLIRVEYTVDVTKLSKEALDVYNRIRHGQGLARISDPEEAAPDKAGDVVALFAEPPAFGTSRLRLFTDDEPPKEPA
jgi:hypothetical protein